MISADNIAQFLSESFLDYPDNSSLSVIFYMPGCDRNCKECQNIDLQNPVCYENEELIAQEILKYCKNSRTNKLCLQGGDPLYKTNINLTRFLLQRLYKDLDICIYTGAEIKEIKNLNLQGFKYMKCGPFRLDLYTGSKKTDDYIQFASKNQYLIDSDFNIISKEGIYYF